MKLSFCFLIVLYVSVGHAAPSTTVGEKTAGTEISHDELIVAVGDELEYIVNGTVVSQLIPLENYNGSMPVALARDPASKQLFFSDWHMRHSNILSVSSDHTGDLTALTTLFDDLTEGKNKAIEGLAFDPVSQSLLWTDKLKLSIQQVSLDPEKSSTNPAAVELVNFLIGDNPQALVADPCNRMIFWINWNWERPTIERSFINGTERQVIVEDDLRVPRGLALDIRKKTIYWANNFHFNNYRIERSNFDGTERELVQSGIGHFVYSLAVSDSFIYWTEWEEHTLWALEKDVSGAQPKIIRHFKHQPMSVILVNNQPLDCAAILNESTSNESTVTDHVTPAYESKVSLCSGYCFNDGECVEVDNELKCRCTDRYSGDRCQDEVNVSTPGPTTASDESNVTDA